LEKAERGVTFSEALLFMIFFPFSLLLALLELYNHICKFALTIYGENGEEEPDSQQSGKKVSSGGIHSNRVSRRNLLNSKKTNIVD